MKKVKEMVSPDSTAAQKAQWLAAVHFDPQGLLPVIAQDARDGRVLTLAWMNAEALANTLACGEMVYWSRSRQELWHKGATSGHTQAWQSLALDCDADALLAQVLPKGDIACHTGRRSCFFQQWQGEGFVTQEEPISPSVSIFRHLENILEARKAADPTQSYVAKLYQAGIDKIAKKVAEEAAEVIIAAKNQNQAEIIYEMADLWFHSMILLRFYDIPLEAIWQELAKRQGISGLSVQAARQADNAS
jgi:phosphoribosyl-ATP pyrophosphohydrolase/phosphoribosyl-AMP cyclohydrolase